MEIPQIDYMRLLVTTREVAERRTSLITLDEPNTTFRVQGDADIRLLDLGIVWAGRAGIEPLFDGSLVANSLSSEQTGAEVGVVCCGPAYPIARLEARIGSDTGPARGLARVRLLADDGSKRRLVVSDWQLCHLAGCKT